MSIIMQYPHDRDFNWPITHELTQSTCVGSEILNLQRSFQNRTWIGLNRPRVHDSDPLLHEGWASQEPIANSDFRISIIEKRQQN
jgi:hypothetical protein